MSIHYTGSMSGQRTSGQYAHGLMKHYEWYGVSQCPYTTLGVREQTHRVVNHCNNLKMKLACLGEITIYMYNNYSL